MKNILLGLILVTIVIVVPRSAYGASEFTEKDVVTYTIQDDGTTHVTYDIKITNNTAEYYTNKYSLGIGSQKISNLKATDKSRTIKTELKQDATTSAIHLMFGDQIVGKNTTRSFSIEYDSTSVTQKLGTSWNITIPRILGTDLAEYSVKVLVPESFGAASTVYPKPAQLNKKSASTEYQFTTEQLKKSGITMNFGDKQVYNMGLTYHLANSQSNSVYTEIALPMNTAYQTIVYDSISPKPTSVVVDEDGNYIARYILKPKEDIQVQVIAKAIVFLNKQHTEKITGAERSMYTQKQPYWETDDEHIASLAASLKTPENIYRYVVTGLTYNSSKVNNNFDRIGAKKILSSPENSVCMEFTDLFVAIARAAGIPAREINGFAYTNDTKLRPASLSQDTLHAWPEYYDEERGWIQVDPTWENTTNGVNYFNTFDLNHIAFVRKGKSSITPYPAGAYKGSYDNTRDVVINFTAEEPEIQNTIDTEIEMSQSFVAGVTPTWKYTMVNKGNTGYVELVTEEQVIGGIRTEEQIPVVVPPFGSITISRSGTKTNYLDSLDILLALKVAEKIESKESRIIPFYRHSVTLIGFAYLLGVPAVALFSYKVLHKNK